jgi:ubiquitin thioesterase CYLD
LSALLSQIMKADPLLHLSSGEHTYFYQLFIEKDEKLLLPTTQILVELSFLQGNVKLKEVSCRSLELACTRQVCLHYCNSVCSSDN